MKKIFKVLVNFKNRLIFYNDNEPLSKLSVVAIIFFDIFILTLLFNGLNKHTNQLTNSYDYVPYLAREIFIEKNWTEENRLESLQNIVQENSQIFEKGYGYSHKIDPFSPTTIKKMHPISKNLYLKYKTISENKDINTLFTSRKKLQEENASLIEQYRQNKDIYEIQLLEKIAQNKEESLKNSEIEDIVKKYSNKVNSNLNQIEVINSKLNNNDLIKNFWTFISKNNEEKIKKDLKTFDFWYPIKVILWQALFLLPLFIFFCFWQMKSLNKNKRLEIIISAHLIVVTAIPIFLRIIDLAIDLIPDHILRDFVNFLIAFRLVAIFYYLLIAVCIILTISLIIIIQKKVFTRERLIKKRILGNLCIKCGQKIPRNSKFCFYCGENQFISCRQCGQLTYFGSKNCMNCGVELEINKEGI